MRLAAFPRMSLLCLLAVGAAPAQADGPLADFLTAAPLFDAFFLNLASNNAMLLGHIEIDLNAPRFPYQSGYAAAGGITIIEPPGIPAPLPHSTISRLATSATGAMQEGKIEVTATTLAPVTLTSQLGMTGGPAAITPEPIFASPAVSITAANNGFSVGSVGGAIAVRGQNQTLDVSDLSTSATGAVSIGQINIVVSNN
jgi:hypothetical protein